jgi:hypothetical protein
MSERRSGLSRLGSDRRQRGELVEQERRIAKRREARMEPVPD